MVSKVEDREDVIPFDTICGNHDYSVWLIKQFKKSCSSNEDTWYLDQAIKLIRYCKRQGRHMEKRMAKTRSAIESLGFKRITKENK
jgi:hypothetical protein